MRAMLIASLVLGTLACQSDSSSRKTFENANAFRFHYEAQADPGSAEGPVDLWIPIPVDTPEQRIEGLEVTASHAYTVRDVKHGTGRVLHVRSPSGAVSASASFTVQRLEATSGDRAGARHLDKYLVADGMIPLDGKVAAIAAEFAGSDNRALARAMYDHTLDRMNYDKPSGGAWGRGDAEWACDSRFGNCTDFHSYFIGLARSRGIPARFEMGFPVPALDADTQSGDVAGYHCWAWFWTSDQGWFPVDISEADKHPELAEYYFGKLDDQRVTFIGGRDVLLDPEPAAGALNLFVYPYAEAAGRPLESGAVTRKTWITGS